MKIAVHNENNVKTLLFLVIIFYPIDQLFSSIFNFNPNLSPLRILNILSVVLLLKVNGYKYLTLSKSFFRVSNLFIVYLFISSFWAIGSVIEGFKYTAQISVLWGAAIVAVFYLRFEERIVEKISFYSVLIGSAVSILSLLGLITAGDVGGSQRLRFEGIGVNAVSISVGYIFCLGVGFLTNKSAKPWQKFVILMCLPILMVFLLKTGTRSVIWGSLLLILPVYIITFKKIEPKFVIILGLLCITAIPILNVIINEQIIEGKLLERISTANGEVLEENSRIDLWTNGFEWYSSNVLGSGTGNEKYVYQLFNKYHEDALEAHNTFISTLVQTNIVGLGLLIFLFIILIKKVLRIEDNSIKFTAMLLLLFFLLQIMKGSVLQTRLFWHPITLILLMIEHSFLINKCSMKN